MEHRRRRAHMAAGLLRVEHMRPGRAGQMRIESEIELFVIRVEKHDEALPVGRIIPNLHAEGAAILICPVLVGHLAPLRCEPVDVLQAVLRDPGATQIPAPTEHVVPAPKPDE